MSAFTREQIDSHNARVSVEAQRARKPHDHPTRPEIPNAKPKRDKGGALGRPLPAQDSSLPRVTLRIVGYRARPLDPDNFASSTKSLIDGLRKAGLLTDDNFWAIKLETEQVKVASYAEEKTEVTITTP